MFTIPPFFTLTVTAIIILVANVVILPTASGFSTTSSSNVARLPITVPFSPKASQPCRSFNGYGNTGNDKLFIGKTVLSMSSDVAAADADKPPASPGSTSSSDGGATVTQLCFNLVKGIVGAGVLSLPAGIAAFANAPSAVVPAVALITVIGALSGYGFALIGRCCAYTKTTSYREAWSATISPKSSWIPATAVTMKTIFATLAYSMILGDTFCSLLSTAGVAATKVPVTLGLTATVLLPLCLMKNLSSLAPFSLVGSLGMLYTAIAMMIRYFGEAYVSTGKFGKDLSANLRPAFGTIGAEGMLTPSAAILVGMLSTAYMAHFNAPKFYNELKEKTLPNYYKVVSTSFGISIAIFTLIASIGFLTFGGNSAGLILNNYSTRDGLMSLSRVAVAVSLVFSYPLAFVGARDGVLDLLKIKKGPSTENVLTVGLLSAITALALVIPDVSFVLSLGGATLGNGLIYIFPALMFRGAIKKKSDATAGQKREVKFALGSAVAGLIMGVLGVKMTLASL